MSAIMQQSLLEWLRERRDNCIRIAKQKQGDDKGGWVEDAAYFEAAIMRIEFLERNRVKNIRFQSQS